MVVTAKSLSSPLFVSILLPFLLISSSLNWPRKSTTQSVSTNKNRCQYPIGAIQINMIRRIHIGWTMMQTMMKISTNIIASAPWILDSTLVFTKTSASCSLAPVKNINMNTWEILRVSLIFMNQTRCNNKNNELHFFFSFNQWIVLDCISCSQICWQYIEGVQICWQYIEGVV